MWANNMPDLFKPATADFLDKLAAVTEHYFVSFERFLHCPQTSVWHHRGCVHLLNKICALHKHLREIKGLFKSWLLLSVHQLIANSDCMLFGAEQDVKRGYLKLCYWEKLWEQSQYESSKNEPVKSWAEQPNNAMQLATTPRKPRELHIQVIVRCRVFTTSSTFHIVPLFSHLIYISNIKILIIAALSTGSHKWTLRQRGNTRQIT